VAADASAVTVTVGPASAASARTWAAASRRTLETVKLRPDLEVPADVVAAFESYLDLWEPLMLGDVFEWTGSVDPELLRHLAAHWARLVTLARDDSETGIAPADPEGQEFYDALAAGFANALAAADETATERFAPRFEEVVPDFDGDRVASLSPMTSSSRLRVLLVDDHPDIRLLVRNGLEADGRFEIVGEATDGQEAIDAACPNSEGGCPDAVLLDLAMPVMDGLEALPRILERCPKAKVIVFSANDEPANRREAEALGASGFLAKGAAIATIASALLDR
jgi:CheY-like chemotaxis protein